MEKWRERGRVCIVCLEIDFLGFFLLIRRAGGVIDSPFYYDFFLFTCFGAGRV